MASKKVGRLPMPLMLETGFHDFWAEGPSMIPPSTLEASILRLPSCVTRPPFQACGVNVTRWLLAYGRRAVTRILRAGDGLLLKSFPGTQGLSPLPRSDEVADLTEATFRSTLWALSANARRWFSHGCGVVRH